MREEPAEYRHAGGAQPGAVLGTPPVVPNWTGEPPRQAPARARCSPMLVSDSLDRVGPSFSNLRVNPRDAVAVVVAEIS